MTKTEFLKKQPLHRVLLASVMAAGHMVAKRCEGGEAFVKANAEMIIMIILSLIAIAICI